MSIKRFLTPAFGVLVASLLVPAAAPAATPGALTVRDATPAIPGFAALDVLQDAGGFAVAGIVGRPGITSVAYGAVGNQLRVSTSGDGVTWSAPRAATLRDPSGNDVPFVIGNQRRLAVAYVNANILPHNYKFVMVYAPPAGSPSGSTEHPVYGPGYDELSNLRYALSPDGVEWVDDQAVVSDSSTEGVIEAGGFKNGILGPTDLVYNTGGDCYSTVTLNTLDWGSASPFSCEFTLVYTAIDAAGNTTVATAGGIFFVDVGLMFRGSAAPALTRAAASWTSAGIDRAHVVRTGASSFAMGLSGSTSAQSCVTDADRCSVGTATSSTGNTFTPVRPSAPAISASDAESIAGSAPQSVTDLQPDTLSTDGRWFAGFDERTFDAHEVVAVGTAPRITFLAPASGYVSATEPKITLVINDDETLGAGIGLDLGKTRITWDGNPIPGTVTYTRTAIGKVTTDGTLVTIPGNDLATPDGTHTLTVRAVDLDGETVTASRSILIDRTAASSAIDSDRSSGFAFPLNSVWVRGTAQDLGTPTGLLRMRGVVTNPLGQQRAFEQGPAGVNSPHAGFTFSDIGPRVNGGGPVSWTFTWTPPPSDGLFWAVPGTYTVQVSAVDFAGNVEGASAANTRSFLLI